MKAYRMVVMLIAFASLMASSACTRKQSEVVTTAPQVTLTIEKASAEQTGSFLGVEIHALLGNRSSRTLSVTSMVSSYFGGFFLIVSDVRGNTLAKQRCNLHMSPYYSVPQPIELSPGANREALRIPINLFETPETVRLQLVGQLISCTYTNEITSDPIEVKIRQPTE